jgi:transcription elongation factor SPT5
MLNLQNMNDDEINSIYSKRW